MRVHSVFERSISNVKLAIPRWFFCHLVPQGASPVLIPLILAYLLKLCQRNLRIHYKQTMPCDSRSYTCSLITSLWAQKKKERKKKLIKIVTQLFLVFRSTTLWTRLQFSYTVLSNTDKLSPRIPSLTTLSLRKRKKSSLWRY